MLKNHFKFPLIQGNLPGVYGPLGWGLNNRQVNKMEICVYVCILLLEEVLEVWCLGRFVCKEKLAKYETGKVHTHTHMFSHTYLHTYCAYIVVLSHSVMSDSYDPKDWILPGSSAHGSFQARKLKWVTDSFSRGSSHLRDQTCVCLLCLLNCRWILYPLSQYMYIKFLN